MKLAQLNFLPSVGPSRPSRSVPRQLNKATGQGAGGSKLLITNYDLYGDPEKVFPNIIDRSINGIYLSNEKSDVEKHLQNRRRKVSYCGSPGAFSEIAAMEICPGCAYVPSKSWGSALADLIAGDVDRAVIPAESYYTKRIRILYDVMVEHDLHIVDEIFLNITHMLLGLQGSKLEDIKNIVSHPQALLQCEKYVRSKKHTFSQVMELPDTADAARQLAIFCPEKTAVISSRRCAYLYNLQVLDESIQDKEKNPTRFVVLGREQIVPKNIDPQQCKTSIFFALPDDDKPGALSKALSFFSENNVNLIWLDSRELCPGESVNYINGLRFLFYVNFEGSIIEERVQRALTGLESIVPFLRVMGSHKLHYKFLEDFQ